MVHCGYDPSGALSTSPLDTWKNFSYNFGAKPKPYYEGRSVNAFNGVSIGKGHLAEAKAAINSTGGGCGIGRHHPARRIAGQDRQKSGELVPVQCSK